MYGMQKSARLALLQSTVAAFELPRSSNLVLHLRQASPRSSAQHAHPPNIQFSLTSSARSGRTSEKQKGKHLRLAKHATFRIVIGLHSMVRADVVDGASSGDRQRSSRACHRCERIRIRTASSRLYTSRPQRRDPAHCKRRCIAHSSFAPHLRHQASRTGCAHQVPQDACRRRRRCCCCC
ncbi:hypothetical protein IE81DRAFT_362476 [Ceraceosorus guamensis]|uniref:Uncharacterized protein n=1 Tax=Ceraceosorus guamensis TaxID=1522189 RepID=A0A316VQZ6_9BASI|nr:hypothetical protein IE81DRAFT_362476 [Ceraceosorus guamensis]PWN40016.1 hypothetical protein IE81DRAFT_362476 [Ceraceosorus guamensis]